MDNPVNISLGNLLQNSKNFTFLRQQGMQLIQQLASATWTDYNLHDPGITMLESLCYAVTEAGLQAGAASVSDSSDDVNAYIANLLTSAQQTAPQDFFTCSQVLPCSPVSLADFQKVLLDHPGIKRAWVSVNDGTPTGNLSVLQQFSPQVNNIISSSVTVNGTAYTINFIFPQWNDPSSQVLQSDLTVQAVSFQNNANPWQQITNTDSYAALITVSYVLPGTAVWPSLSFQLFVLLQIATPLVSEGDLPLVLQAGAALMAILGDNSDSDVTILKQYNRRLIYSADENNDLNSNILSTEGEVNVSGQTYPYQTEIALPYWDDPETAPFQNDVTITFNSNPFNPWKPIPGTDSYFSFLTILVNNKPISWPIVLRIVSPSTPLSSKIRDAILTDSANSLITTPSTNPTLLKQYNQKVMMAFESSHRIRSYLKSYRNLCESFSVYRSVRIQEVAISCIIEMGAGADIESLLANIFYTIYQYISPQVIPQSLSELQSQVSTETIFEGPLLRNGFIPDSLLSSNLPSNTLYVSDVIRLIMQMGTGTDIQTRVDEQNRPVISVTNVSLSLYLDNRSITTGARDCLQLIDNSRYIAQLSLEKCNITVTRNNTVVSYDLDNVLDLYNEQINSGDSANVISPDAPEDIPIPVGESLALGEYYSIQNDLPLTYGIGETGLPASSSAQRLGQAKQLQGYLFIFEQVLAGYFTQLAHVNALFTANVAESTTLYQLPLYNVPAASDLLLPLAPPYTTWQDFINDGNNSYMQILKTGPETEDQFLSRRHQMLDHLLGRLGEDMQDFSSLIYRQSYSNPNFLTSSASAALLQYKADYYYALPDLEKNRAQAFGHPAWRNNDLVTITSSPDGSFFLWQISDGNGNILFVQSVPETNKTSAGETAESALVLATSALNYTTETDFKGLQRIALGWSAGAQSIAISNKTYATVTGAENDILVVQQSVLKLWLKYSLSSLEARLYHLLGIGIKGERRKLINPISNLFDIFNAATPPPFDKKFHLRSSADSGSQILLQSINSYSDNIENTADTKATAVINEVIKYGILPGNFSDESSLKISVTDADGKIIAESPSSYPSDEKAQAAIIQIQQLLYRYYSIEGFYIIEHILLYPVTTGDTALIFPASTSSCLPVSSTGIPYSLPKDPYSFILTVVFPSGYAHDFSDTSLTPSKLPMQPDRFRDPEFRQYAEQNISKFCPAHILPLVVWIDTALPGTPLVNGSNKLYPCFDNLESTYTSWLTAFFTDEVDPTVLAPFRNNLVSVLNGIFQM